MQPTEEIKSRLNIVELIQSYVRLEKAGNYWKAPCPFHQERTPSFVVNEERNMWHCFGCNKGGDAFAFIMEIENVSFRESLEMLADRTGVELPRYNQEAYSQEKSLKEKLTELLELATKFYEKQLWEGEGKNTALPYLRKRGLTDQSIKTFRLGYAPKGWNHLGDFLKSKNYSQAEIEQAGLGLKKTGGSSTYDRFRDRIMFPIENPFGKVIGYSARLAPGNEEKTGKYINTPETVLYHKSDVLYGIVHAKNSIKENGEAILVEGNIDVIALHQAGFKQAVAVSGTALTQEQLRTLKRYAGSLKLFFDMDEAGQKAARKSTELAFQNEFQVSLVQIPSGKDAADLAAEDVELLGKCISEAKDAPEAFLEQLTLKNNGQSAQGKKNIVDDFAILINHMRSHVVREHWIHVLSQRLQIKEDALREDIHQKLETKETPPKNQGIKAPQTKTEILREEYIALLLVLPGQWQEEEPQYSESLKNFIALHPLHFYIVQAGKNDVFSLIQEKELQQLASKLLFELSRKEEARGILASDLLERRREDLKSLSITLEEELNIKPRLQELEALLAEARKKSDKLEEQKLLEEFTRLSIRFANKP